MRLRARVAQAPGGAAVEAVRPGARGAPCALAVSASGAKTHAAAAPSAAAVRPMIDRMRVTR